jgi:retron-type reverse transcriptase
MPLEILQNIPLDYMTLNIPKRSGGYRKLSVPKANLKLIQRRIHKRLLRRLRTHPMATGFEPGLSIVHNAMVHTHQAVMIKMDLKDFFPSIKTAKITQYFQRIGWDRPTAQLLARLTTHEDCLPQGAPTSPRLSNLINFQMDFQIQRAIKRYRGTYTRYADDITISFPKDFPIRIRGTIQKVRNIARSHAYEINEKKTHILRQHQQQRVTGLVVNDKVNLPREKRRWLRAVEHRLQTGGEASLTAEQLAGYKALQQMIQTQTTEAQ